MSLWANESEVEKLSGGLIKGIPKDDCFLCSGSGGKLSYPLIMWMGASGNAFFHPSCARSFAIRLLRDVHEWESKFDGEFK